MGRRLIRNQQVVGSNPTGGSKKPKKIKQSSGHFRGHSVELRSIVRKLSEFVKGWPQARAALDSTGFTDAAIERPAPPYYRSTVLSGQEAERERSFVFKRPFLPADRGHDFRGTDEPERRMRLDYGWARVQARTIGETWMALTSSYLVTNKNLVNFLKAIR